MADEKVKVGANLKFKLLKNDFVAGMQKDDRGLFIIVAPSSPTERNVISIEDIVNAVKQTVELKPDQEQNLRSSIEGNLNEMKAENNGTGTVEFTLQQAYFYYHSYKKNKEDKKDTSDIEYAFSLKVNFKDSKFGKVAGIFELGEASISIWNTERMSILKTMSIFDIQQFLEDQNKELEIAKKVDQTEEKN